MRARQEARRALVEARRVRENRNRRLWTVVGPILVAVLAVSVMVAVKLSSDATSPAKAATTARAEVIAQLGGVPAATLNAVGAGQPTALPARINGPALTAHGKPRVLYVGAEYCPFCAVERWPALGGKYAITGATYDPQLLAGKTQEQIAATLRDPASRTGAGVDGAANVITAALCKLTGGQPSNVCSSPDVTAADKMLP